MPTSAEALAVILLAIVPGYTARVAWARGKTFGLPASDLNVVVQSIAGSLVIQVLLAPITIPLLLAVRDNLGDHPWRVAAWAAVAVLVLPVVGGYALGRLTDQLGTDGSLAWLPSWLRRDLAPPLPSIWDVVNVEGRIPDLCLLVIEFTDGRRLAGAYGDGAEVVTSPGRHGLFLAEEWLVDEAGMPTEPVANSGGVVVPDLSGIRSLRVLVPEESRTIPS